MKLENLPEKYRRQAERQIAGANRISRQIADMESGAGNAPLRLQKIAGFDRQVDLYYLEKRHRLADPDNSVTKYCTDAMVSCGILENDSANEIGKVYKEQVKIPKDQPEETVIEIWRSK